MRVAADSQLLEVEPGDSASLTLEVVNTDDIIDGVSAHIIGIPDNYVSTKPRILPLFPDAAGTLTLGVAVPTSHPAGRHPLTVRIDSHGTTRPPSYIDIDLQVAARPGVRIEVRPAVVRARRSARFVMSISNYGNVPLDVTLTGLDPDRQMRVSFTPERRLVPPGAIVPVLVDVRGPRMITGAEIDRTVVIDAAARVLMGPGRPALLAPAPDTNPPDITTPDTDGAGPEPGTDDPDAAQELILGRECTVTLRQKPLISRGLLTCLILLTIVGVWAAIFLFGLARVFASDPMTKQAPASFFAANANPAGASPGATAGGAAGGAASGAAGGAAGGAASGAAGGAGGAAAAAPAGALSKSGQLPPGLGGTIAGTVRAVNDQQPVGRILVQAYRLGRNGPVLMSSAASQADGTYTLAGLFPTNYYLQFSASGYVTQWYPGSPTRVGAQAVPAAAEGTTSGIDVRIRGKASTIAGKVDPGDTLKPVVTTVTARPLLGSSAGKAAATARTKTDGSYTLANLPSPGSYQLTFTTPGYESNTLVESVVGGDRRLEPTVVLGASTGQISGTVSEGGTPLGAARISTTVNGKALTVLTPTTGQVGQYVLGNLPTPATYVITISDPGHGTTSRIVDLTAGQRRAALDVSLANGIGSVSGRVVGPDGQGLGGATVRVGGAVTSGSAGPSATTLTSGSPGQFAINRLTAPGSYTLFVTLAGYSSASVPVTLAVNGPPASVTVRLASRLGSIAGVVSGPSGPFAGATVTATDGQHTFTGTSNSSDGHYLISDLHPGSYSVTVTATGLSQQTALVTVANGRTTAQNLRVRG